MGAQSRSAHARRLHTNTPQPNRARPRRRRRDPEVEGCGVLSLLAIVSDQIRAARLAEDARAQRGADSQGLRLEAALDEWDALVRRRPG